MSGPFPPEGVQVLSISELSRQLKGLLEAAYPCVWLSGEVSNLSRPSSGHVYLSLKDADATLRSVMYRGVSARLKFDLRDGMEVVVRGRINVYMPRGEYQLSIEELQPKGIGPLELAFRQLREKLFQQGFFDPRRKKPIPAFPKRIALVTSPTGAAVRDMLEILGRRWPRAEVIVCPVRVQGEGAADSIAAGIHLVNKLPGVDVLIVGRGGGSLEDLWCFNEESVARAIHASRIPVVSGVGHETDLTIADLVADVRALTPSEAAERVVPDRQELLGVLQQYQNRLRTLLHQSLQRARTQLSDLARRRCFRLPFEILREQERRLDELGDRLQRGGRQKLERLRQRLEAYAGQLHSLSPLNVLSRGYSLTRREADGNVVRSPAQVQVGDLIVTEVHQGRIVSRAEACFSTSADTKKVEACTSPPINEHGGGSQDE